MGPDIFYFKEGNVMALDRYIALIIAVIFLIYGYTAFFEMDGLLPPILKRNPCLLYTSPSPRDS